MEAQGHKSAFAEPLNVIKNGKKVSYKRMGKSYNHLVLQVRVDLTSEEHVIWLNDLEEDAEYSRWALLRCPVHACS